MVAMPQVPNFNHLYYFHVVASEGSLSKAAQRLRVTQPTISAQIRQLEDVVGHRLFERSGRGMRLTPKGEYVAEHTSVMFRASQRMIQGLRPRSGPAPKSLAIGVAVSVANTLATRTFVPLLCSEVTLQIKHGEQEYLLRELLSRDLDILLGDKATIGGGERRLVVEEIFRPTFVAVAPRAMAQKVRSFPQDLARIPLMLYPPSSRHRWEIERYLGDHGTEPTIIGETEDVGIMLACVQAGACAAILPGLHLDTIPARQRPVVLGSLAIEAPVFAYHQKNEAGDLIKDAIDLLKRTYAVAKRGVRFFLRPDPQLSYAEGPPNACYVISFVIEPEREDNDSGPIDAVSSRLPMVVHELRGPMTAIQGAAALLELRLSKFDLLPPGIPAVLDRLRRNVDLLARMTHDLMALGRSQLGPEVLERRPADLLDIVAQTLTDGPWAERVRLVTSLGEVPLICDADRLGQVVLNLVRNAVEHGRGGAIEVGIGRGAGGFVLTVENDGALPPAVHAHLFEPFVRGQPAGKGFGLGLYLVRRFVEAHGGTVSVDSDGRRVRFSVFLPAS